MVLKRLSGTSTEFMQIGGCYNTNAPVTDRSLSSIMKGQNRSLQEVTPDRCHYPSQQVDDQ